MNLEIVLIMQQKHCQNTCSCGYYVHVQCVHSKYNMGMKFRGALNFTNCVSYFSNTMEMLTALINAKYNPLEIKKIKTFLYNVPSNIYYPYGKSPFIFRLLYHLHYL